MNDILDFLKKECDKSFYKGDIKTIRVKNKEGYDLMVSDYKVRTDSFLALARFYGL
jgi:hypothetical protein